MRICAIDVGTNTVNSLVADLAHGRLVVLADDERFARLGQGVDRAGRLAPEAMDRVVDRLAQSLATARGLGVERVVIGATSASRDASNVGELQARVRDELGLDYAVITGADEARLSFLGALAMLPAVPRAVVFDVGGGSTEIASGARGAAPAFARSLNVGTVRLTERHGAVPPVDPGLDGSGPLAAVAADVRAALAEIPPEVWVDGPLVGTGSTAKVIAHLAGGSDVPLAQIRASRERLATLSPEAITALAPDVMTGRADVALSALVIVQTILEASGAERFVASAGGLRHGLALEAASAAP
ncbi:hypothetical protein [Rubricoccus marinus]|uniref:Ppx/GppA phosphatase N-terminal domain-containing protein n=1 Tax=Rubricoccus marinus TaxID=716817 RepID=A0A259U0M4_9BACT|nr:hypothetical protein [Rubricoccus marinus]OZC03573.1 hypothetical protein BSZ36_11630 [Rubricoccus marinus]